MHEQVPYQLTLRLILPVGRVLLVWEFNYSHLLTILCMYFCGARCGAVRRCGGGGGGFDMCCVLSFITNSFIISFIKMIIISVEL